VDLTPIVHAINDSPVGEWMRSNVKALPVVNVLHVVAITTVFGTIFIVDLRLLGLPNTSRPFTQVSHETVRWTWGAFALAVLTGSLMFTANANTYYVNLAFWLKMGVILLAGINMAIFELVLERNVKTWDTGPTPLTARIAGGLSIGLWATVILLGRIIGFTKKRDFSIPQPVDFDFGGQSSMLDLHHVVAACADWVRHLA
jgi:hypothetical protein